MTDQTRDIVERLRRVKEPGYVKHTPSNTFTSNALYVNPDGRRAADHIEALTKRVAELEETLKNIASRSHAALSNAARGEEG